MEGTQKPWWLRRSVCCCLGFVKPFSYLVPALKVPDNCSADNFIIKLNMSGWQSLSCLLLFFYLTVCSLTPGTGDEGNMPFSDYLPLVPARRLLSFQPHKRIKPNSISQLPPFPPSSSPLGSTALLLTILAIHICWPKPNWRAHHFLLCFSLFSPLLIYFNQNIYVSQIHLCVKKIFWGKKKKAGGLSRVEVVLCFSQKKQETGGRALDRSLLAKEPKQLQGGRKASKLSVTFNVTVKYFSHQLQYWLHSSHSGSLSEQETKKEKMYFLLPRVQERNLSTIIGFCLKQC